MVYYRKYRPQTIQQLDSGAVREQLYAVLSQAHVPHAFLFTGPKGLGKTSTARIVAKVVNCESRSKNQEARIKKKGGKRKKEELDIHTHDSSFITHDSKDIEPCNTCLQCTSITNGTNLDVLEIDGASNRGIDEIRDLREKIKLSPLSARKKVYIIDEVHMLTTEAFNALLKTLEEPPAHVMFILCTTEPHKVPPTIVSRCVGIQFKRAAEEELVRSFTRIAAGEKLKIDADAMRYIAHLSDGGFRDGAKVLEEVALLAKGEPITKEFVEEKFQISNFKFQIDQMIEFLEEKDTKKGLELIQNIVEQGADMKYVIEQLINTLHSMLLDQLGIERKEEIPVTNEELRIEDIKRLIELLTRAHGELKYAVLPQLPLELAVIEWGTNEEIDGRLPQENTIVGGRSLSENRHPSLGDIPEIKSGPVFSSLGGGKSSIPKDKKDIWFQFIDAVKQKNHSVAGVLRGCILENNNSGTITIAAKYKFHKDKLSEPEATEFLEQAWEEMSGNKVQVKVELKQ